MEVPDFGSFDRGIERALRALPVNAKRDRDLWLLRSELRCLQMKGRRLKLLKDRAQQIAKELGVRRKQTGS
jgi:hypothetical protein